MTVIRSISALRLPREVTVSQSPAVTTPDSSSTKGAKAGTTVTPGTATSTAASSSFKQTVTPTKLPTKGNVTQTLHPGPVQETVHTEGAASVSFIVVFVLGFIGVALYYGYKKGALRRLPRYRYSVLHQFENENDDEFGDYGQNDVDLMANLNDSSEDEDVTFDRNLLLDEDSSPAVFLGQTISTTTGNPPPTVSCNYSATSTVANSSLHSPSLVTLPTQLSGNGLLPSIPVVKGVNGTLQNKVNLRLDDSDEELLQ